MYCRDLPSLRPSSLTSFLQSLPLPTCLQVIAHRRKDLSQAIWMIPALRPSHGDSKNTYGDPFFKERTNCLYFHDIPFTLRRFDPRHAVFCFNRHQMILSRRLSPIFLHRECLHLGFPLQYLWPSQLQFICETFPSQKDNVAHALVHTKISGYFCPPSFLINRNQGRPYTKGNYADPFLLRALIAVIK